MSVLCEDAVATHFPYCHILRIFQQRVHVTYFSVQNGIFDSDYVFLLHISISFHYLDHLNGTDHVFGPLWNEIG